MSRIPLLLTTVAVAASSTIMFIGQMKLSPTNDEPANVSSGYVYITTGRFVDPTHPPLVRYLIALPLFVLQPSPFPDDPDAEKDWHTFGRKFLFSNRTPWQSTLWAARGVVIVLYVLLLFLVFTWTRLLWGEWAAATATIFLAFEPTLMGHGSLATLDAGATLFFFLCIFSFWCYRASPSRARFLFFVLCLALGLLSKFSNGILFFVLPLVSMCSRRLSPSTPTRCFRVLSIAILLPLIVAGAYGFRCKRMSEDPQIVYNREAKSIASGIKAVADHLGTDSETLMDIPIPLYDFLKGLGLQVFHAAAQDKWEDPDFFQYLNGEYSRTGWRSYYFWTFALKSTIPTILFTVALLILLFGQVFRSKSLMARGLAINLLGGEKIDLKLWPFLVLPPCVHFFVCSISTIAIGHRYLLPIYPFLAMGVGFLFISCKTRRVPLLAFVLLLSWHIASSLAVWPHQIAYFNEAVGGPRSGFRYLADSNIDWGQDLLYLKQDVTERRSQGVAVYGDVFGTVRPEDIGLDLAPIPDKGMVERRRKDTTIYLSVNRYLLRSASHPKGLYPWLVVRNPDRVIGVSILAFDLQPLHSFQ